MIKRIIVTLCFLPSILCAQKVESSKKLSVGLNFSPDYSCRILSTDGSETAKRIAELRDDFEVPKFGFTSGISIIYQPVKHFFFETGIFYADKGEKTKRVEFSPIVPLDGNGNPSPDPASPSSATFNYHYEYLEIPFKINYTFTCDKFMFFIGSGIAYSHFLNYRSVAHLEYADGRKKRTTSNTPSEDFKKSNLVVLFAAGCQYKLSEHILFKAEPIYRVTLFEIIQAPIRSHLYSIGLNTGLYYCF